MKNRFSTPRVKNFLAWIWSLWVLFLFLKVLGHFSPTPSCHLWLAGSCCKENRQDGYPRSAVLTSLILLGIAHLPGIYRATTRFWKLCLDLWTQQPARRAWALPLQASGLVDGKVNVTFLSLSFPVYKMGIIICDKRPDQMVETRDRRLTCKLESILLLETGAFRVYGF